jgi:capsular exopolysaccharide synthesis family protein
MTTQKPKIEEINIKDLVLTIFKKWYIFVIIGICAISIAFYSILTTPPTYSTEGTIIMPSKNDALSAAMKQFSLASFLFNAEKSVDDEMIILKSKNISQQLVEVLDLQADCFYKKKFGCMTELYKNEPIKIKYPDNFKQTMIGLFEIKIIKKQNNWDIQITQNLGRNKIKHKETINSLDQPIQTQWGEFLFTERPEFIDKLFPNYHLEFKIAPLKTKVEQYNSQIIISASSKKANAINISIIGNNITKNETIINTVIELYQQFHFEQQIQNTIKLDNFISERISIIDQELAIIEKKIEEFRINKNLANIELQSESALESSREYSKLLTEVDMEFTTMSFIEKFIKESDQLELIPTNTGITDEALANLIITHNNNLIEYLRLNNSVTNTNPYLLQLKEQIILSRKNILQTITNMKESSNLKRQDIIKRSEKIEQQIKDVPSIEREYIAITREQEIKHKLYLFLLEKREELQFAMSSNNSTNIIIDKAYTLDKIISPNKKTILLVAVFLTIIIGLAYIFINSFLDKKILNIDQLTKTAISPILGIIPNSKKTQQINNSENKKLVETFRSIRSNIQIANKKATDKKTILLTSTKSTEGKSFTAMNLALSFANMKKQSILVCLDINQSTINKSLKLNNNIGIAEYLNDQNSINDITQKYNDHLDVISFGSKQENTSDLLDFNKLNLLFTHLKNSYEHIIIDSAPLSTSTDTLLLEHYADNIIFICQKDKTKKSDIEKLNTLIEESKLNNVSIIFNTIQNIE